MILLLCGNLGKMKALTIVSNPDCGFLTTTSVVFTTIFLLSDGVCKWIFVNFPFNPIAFAALREITEAVAPESSNETIRAVFFWRQERETSTEVTGRMEDELAVEFSSRSIKFP